jgi:hypothetical protein
MNRGEMCALLADAVSERMNVCAEQIADALAGWEMIACKGAVIVRRDNEIHCGAMPSAHGTWLTRRVLRDHVKSVVERYGKATTSVLKDNDKGHEFVRRIGFRETSRDASKVYYEMTEMRHV